MLRYIHPSEVIKNIHPEDLEGIKVTFVNMPLRETALPNTAPLGPALLSARLLEYGAIPTIVDLNAYRIKDKLAEKRGLENGRHLTLRETRDLLKKHFAKHGDQNIVAFSGLITTLKWQESVAKIVRELQPNTFLVSGGGLATELRVILFDWIPEINAIACSEGDDIIVKIAYDAGVIQEKGFKSALCSGKLKPYYLGEINRKPRFLYEGGPVFNLDELPLPAWELLEEDVNGFRIFDFYLQNPVWGSSACNSSATPFTMQKSATTVSSRGCPYNCKFCYRGQQGGRNYRTRSAQNLAKEIKWYVEKYGVDFVGLVDDNFMVVLQRIADFVPIMKPLIRATGIKWGTHSRLDEAADLRPDPRHKNQFISASPRRVNLMAEAGCVYIGFGGESADASILKSMGKGGFTLANGMVKTNGYYFPRSMVEGIKNTKQAGIHANCTWIMGWPGENLEKLKNSVAFIKWQEEYYTRGLKPGTPEYEIAINSVNKNMFIATAYPGTELFLHPMVRKELTKNFGIKFDLKTLQPIYDKNMHHYILELDDATKTLYDQSGKPLNFSDMPMDVFLEAGEYIAKGETFKILEMM